MPDGSEITPGADAPVVITPTPPDSGTTESADPASVDSGTTQVPHPDSINLPNGTVISYS